MTIEKYPPPKSDQGSDEGGGRGGPDPTTVIGLVLGEIRQAMHEHFMDLVRTHAWSEYRKYAASTKAEEQREFDKMAARLDNWENTAAIELIWKESDFVTPAELKKAGYERSFSAEDPLSRYSLGGALWEAALCDCKRDCECEVPDQGAFRTQATRIAEALLSFQLVTEDDRGNKKLLAATPLLDTIMREHTIYCADLISTRLLDLLAAIKKQAGS